LKIDLAAVQMISKPLKVKENLHKASRLIEKAVEKGAKIVVLPELFNTGYFFNKALYDVAEEIGGPTTRWMENICAEKGIYLAGAIYERDGDEFYDTMLTVGPNELLGTYRKRNPATTENVFFKPGTGSPVYETQYGKAGVMICWDMRFPEIAHYYNGKIDYLLVSSAWPDFRNTLINWVGKWSSHLPTALAGILVTPVAYANMAGPVTGIYQTAGYVTELDTTFAGNTTVINYTGETLSLVRKGEGVAYGSIDLDEMKLVRTSLSPTEGISALRKYIMAKEKLKL